jgi:hypothetical protein
VSRKKKDNTAPTSIWPSVVKEKTSPIDRELRLKDLYSVFAAGFLTNDSIVPAFVFGQGRKDVIFNASAPNIYQD